MILVKKIILFDGPCHFCQWNVQFIIKRDPKGKFRFAPLKSEIGQKLLDHYEIPRHIDSLIFIHGDMWFDQSSAVLNICRYLKGFWKLFFLLLIIPKPFRDIIYRFIAKNRYRFNRKQKKCAIPTPETKKRFLSTEDDLS